MTAVETETLVRSRPSLAARERSLDHARISNWNLFLYALPSVPIAFVHLPLAILLPAYYAGTLHVDLSAIGLALLASRSFDVVLDPLIGSWSDKTRSRFGRRKLWMAMGLPILMIGSYILFVPPVTTDGWYLLLASFVLYAGASTVSLPYSAWGTELVETYDGRARMAGFRETAAIFGGLLAAMIPAATGYFGHGVDRFTMSIMALAIIVMAPLTTLIAATAVPEPAPQEHKPSSWISDIGALFRNGPFRILCLAYVLFSIGGSVATGTMVFYINFYLRSPTAVGLSLLALAITTIAAVPLWLRIARRFGKHVAVASSLLLTLLIFSTVLPWIAPGQGMAYVALMSVLGIASSGYITLPIGIIGDVIDFDTLKHRSARGGLYWGVWSLSQKAAPALGIAITLQVLKMLSFNPAGHNTTAALTVLKYAYCFGPVPFMLLGGLLLLLFPITSRRHALIRRRLENRDRRARAAVSGSVGLEHTA